MSKDRNEQIVLKTIQVNIINLKIFIKCVDLTKIYNIPIKYSNTIVLGCTFFMNKNL